MKVKFIADSTFVLEHNGCRILTDPWIGTTIYGGAWMQFPPPVLSADDIGPLDYIFISHIHEDHCDPLTLARLDKNAKIVILDREPNFVKRFLERHGFNFRDIVTVPTFEKFTLAPGLAIEPLEANPAKSMTHLIDSSMALHTDTNKSVYFGNDNSAYPDLLRHLSQYEFSLALLPAAGGAGYPACYTNLDDAERAMELERIRRAYFENFAETTKALKPDNFMAVAGYHIIAGKHAPMNKDMAFLTNPATAYKFVYDRLSEDMRGKIHPVQLAPGEELDCDADRARSSQEAWKVATNLGDWEARKAAYLKNVASKSVYTHETQELPEDLDWEALFRTAGTAALGRISAGGVPFTSRIYVRLPEAADNRTGLLDGSARTVECLEQDAPRIEPYLEVSCDDKLLFLLLTGAFSWNIADAGCLLRFYRAPNVFDHSAFIALNYLAAKSMRPEEIQL